jgi:hypothetical protein
VHVVEGVVANPRSTAFDRVLPQRSCLARTEKEVGKSRLAGWLVGVAGLRRAHERAGSRRGPAGAWFGTALVATDSTHWLGLFNGEMANPRRGLVVGGEREQARRSRRSRRSRKDAASGK